jgi:hypothetical protein
MSILGKQNFNGGVQAVELDRGLGNNQEYQAFSTPFQKTPKGNLSLPLVWDRYTSKNFIYFGEDNLYPQYLNQVYYSSPLHGAIVDFKTQASVGGGYEVDESELSVKERVDYYTFTKRLQLNKLVPSLTKEYILHNRVYFLIHLKGGKCTKMERVYADKVRKNIDGSIYSVAYDWTYQTGVKEYKPYHKKCKDGVFMLEFAEQSVGMDIYPLPQYTSALNFAFLSGELSYLAKSNIQNSVFPSFALKFPKKPQNDEEMQQIKDTVNKMKGAENAGKAVAFFANNKEQLPEMDAIPTNQNDSLFKEASELITEQICFSHTIDPILLGVRTTGSLGNGSDIKQAYVIFEKNVIMGLRNRIEEIINSLFEIAGINATIEIKNYQIINETIVEIEEEGSATSDALNAMSPLVATKVLESMTQNEIRALAGLSSVEGGDKTREQREAEATGEAQPNQPSATPKNPATPEEPTEEILTNDNLKGLSAKENQDIMRIVRDFSKGRLNEVLARTRLMAYGFDGETIKEILGL